MSSPPFPVVHRPTLPDPDKPPMPYVIGASFTASHHIPADPLLLPYEHVVAPLPAMFQSTWTQLGLCLELKGRKADVNADYFSFKLLEELAVGDGRGPQVFRVGENLVVKIFDPLYYHAVFPYSGLRPHVVNLADYHHNNEVAAYMELFPKFGGVSMPQFLGSHTIEIPANTPDGTEVSREVRLIVMEYLGKSSMDKIDPASLAPEKRLSIMKRVLETEMQFLYEGVRLNELAPCNVMLVGDDKSKDWDKQDTFRVVLLDFDEAAVGRLVMENVMKETLPKPLSPAAWHAANPGLLRGFAAAGWAPRAADLRGAWVDALFRGRGDAYLAAAP
jgi:hypothetical protein